MNPIFQQLIDAPNWEERYRLIIQAGKNLPLPAAEQLAKMQQISGCEVNVWFYAEKQNDGHFAFLAYSEARIMNGLLWLLLQQINGQTTEQLQTFDIQAFYSELGIAARLSSTRLNGLKEIEQILHHLA